MHNACKAELQLCQKTFSWHVELEGTFKVKKIFGEDCREKSVVSFIVTFLG